MSGLVATCPVHGKTELKVLTLACITIVPAHLPTINVFVLTCHCVVGQYYYLHCTYVESRLSDLPKVTEEVCGKAGISWVSQALGYCASHCAIVVVLYRLFSLGVQKSFSIL